jgi:hypothetical protein
MRVELLGNTSSAGLDRVSGRVHWEARDRPSQDVYVAAPSNGNRALADDGDWLLLGALMSAQKHREPRLRVDAPVSPVLLGHLRSAQGLLQAWYGEAPVPIEAPRLSLNRPSVRANALLLSGGLDSVTSLFTYIAEVPSDHPDALRYVLNVDVAGEDDPTRRRPTHDTVLNAIHPFSEMTGVELLAVVTNLRQLEANDFGYDWMLRAHGAIFAAVAHALSPFIGRMLIASSYDYPNLVPWGSHPALDPMFSSADVVIDHHNAHLSRYTKLLRLLELGGTEAIRSLVVCTGGLRRRADQLPNCGRCEKCLRTLTALTAAGVDTQQLTTFEERAVSPGLIRRIGRFRDQYEFNAWRELVAPLASTGRDDLSRAVATKVRRNEFFEFDRRRLGGATWRAKVAASKVKRRLIP